MTRRELFAMEFVLDLNGTAAAIRAGYSEKSAHAQASRLLRDAEVKADIQARKERRGRDLAIDAATVLRELAKLAFYDPRDLFREDGTLKGFDELDGVTSAAVSGFEVVSGKDGAHTRPILRKIRLADRGVALERLGRHLGLFSGEAAAPSDRLDELIAALNAGPVHSGTTIDAAENLHAPQLLSDENAPPRSNHGSEVQRR